MSNNEMILARARALLHYAIQWRNACDAAGKDRDEAHRACLAARRRLVALLQRAQRAHNR